MVRTCDAEPFSTLTIFPLSRSAIRKLRSLSGMSPQGAARSEAISVARGSPREATPLELGLLDGALEGDAELAAVGSAVRVSALGSLAAPLQAVVSSSAPHGGYQPKAPPAMSGWPMSGWHGPQSHHHSLAGVLKADLMSEDPLSSRSRSPRARRLA